MNDFILWRWRMNCSKYPEQQGGNSRCWDGMVYWELFWPLSVSVFVRFNLQIQPWEWGKENSIKTKIIKLPSGCQETGSDGSVAQALRLKEVIRGRKWQNKTHFSQFCPRKQRRFHSYAFYCHQERLNWIEDTTIHIIALMWTSDRHTQTQQHPPGSSICRGIRTKTWESWTKESHSTSPNRLKEMCF